VWVCVGEGVDGLVGVVDYVDVVVAVELEVE